MNKKIKYICIFYLLLIFGLSLRLDTYAADTGNVPYVTKAKLISNCDIELYWSEEVTNAGEIENYSVTVDGKNSEIYSYTWEEYDYSETGVVYYNPKSAEYPNNPDTPKTSIRLWNAITVTDTKNLPEIKVTVAGNTIKNTSGKYAAQQTIAVTEYDPFYQQEIVMDCGVKIIGTKNVRPEAMTKAEEMLKVILENEEIARRMGDAGCMLGIFGEGEIAYDILEHRYSYDENYLYVEGFGGTELASIKDANVLRLTEEDYYTNYRDESILVHEFGHTVQNYGLSEKQYQEWENIYKTSVLKDGKWANSYAGSNSSEYFATLSAVWFNAMDDTYDGQWDGVRGPINTREELKAYDVAAYTFLSRIYVSDQYLPSPWENGSVPDNHTWSNPSQPQETPGDDNTDHKENAGGNEEQILAPAEKTCRVTFVYHNGVADRCTEVLSGNKAVQPEQPVRKGYLWQGWYREGVKFSFDSPVTGDIVLEAKWQKVKVGQSAVSSLKAAKNGKVSLKIKKVSGADGYKIIYSTHAGCKKGIKTKYISANKLNVKKMKKGVWYFKVQAYKIDSTGEKIFGKISKAKKVKVKK